MVVVDVHSDPVFAVSFCGLLVLVFVAVLCAAQENMKKCTNNKPHTTLYNLGCGCQGRCLFFPNGELSSISVGGGRGTKRLIGYTLRNGTLFGDNVQIACAVNTTAWRTTAWARELLQCDADSFCQPSVEQLKVLRNETTLPPVVLQGTDAFPCCADMCLTCTFFIQCSSCKPGFNTDLTPDCVPGESTRTVAGPTPPSALPSSSSSSSSSSTQVVFVAFFVALLLASVLVSP
jgi:hypothetical protein